MCGHNIIGAFTAYKSGHALNNKLPVSYTHLDVYKRQTLAMLFLAGAKLWQFIAIIGMGISAVVLLILAEPYRIPVSYTHLAT